MSICKKTYVLHHTINIIFITEQPVHFVLMHSFFVLEKTEKNTLLVLKREERSDVHSTIKFEKFLRRRLQCNRRVLAVGRPHINPKARQGLLRQQKRVYIVSDQEARPLELVFSRNFAKLIVSKAGENSISFLFYFANNI